MRESFSLDLQEIRPLAGFGTRRRNVLREAGYAWTPRSGVSSNSLRYDFLPIWVLFPFLVFFECLSGLRPLGAVGSVPKHETELIQIFFKPNGAAVATPRLCGYENVVFCGLNCVLNGFEAGNGHEMRVYI